MAIEAPWDVKDREGTTETRRHGEASIDEATDAILEHRDVEVEQESELETAELQVGQELGLVDGAPFPLSLSPGPRIR
jgi:hypothetical protein